MPQAEVSRLAANLAATGPGLYEATSFASSACSDLVRWALERSCVLGPELVEDFSKRRNENLHHDYHFYQHYINNNIQSGANNVTTITLQQQAAQFSHNNFYDGIRSRNGADSSQLIESPLTKLVTNHMLEPTHQLESKLDYYFSDIWLSSGDERTNKLPFIGASPWKLVYATIIYLYLIKWLLPRIMQPFKPLELNWLIRLYNLSMVISNMWAFYHGARILNFGLKCFGCETIDHHDTSPQAIELLHYGWLFFLSRLVEWLDTIFFVLRKKERQVTKLHVFHHSFVPLISWTYLKYHPGYTVAFFPFINSFVHSIMYTYYLLATFGTKIQPYLWWKRYLTSLQIAQFVLIIIQLASIPMTGDETCQYPRGFLYVAFAGAILFLWLFYTYYLETYTRNKQHRASAKSGAVPSGISDANERSDEERKQLIANGKSTAANDRLQAMKSTKKRISFDLVRNKTRNDREGSSRSLSDTIDNAISCDEPAPPST